MNYLLPTSLSRNSKFVEEKAAHLSRAVSIHKEPPKKVSEFSCIFSGSATPFCVCLKSQWKCLYDELIREAKITHTLAHGLKMRQITETDLEEWLFKSKKLLGKIFLILPMLPLLLMMIANKVVLTLTSPIFRIICLRI